MTVLIGYTHMLVYNRVQGFGSRLFYLSLSLVVLIFYLLTFYSIYINPRKSSFLTSNSDKWCAVIFSYCFFFVFVFFVKCFSNSCCKEVLILFIFFVNYNLFCWCTTTVCSFYLELRITKLTF